LRAFFLDKKPENDAETRNKQTSVMDKKPGQDGPNGLHLYEQIRLQISTLLVFVCVISPEQSLHV